MGFIFLNRHLQEYTRMISYVYFHLSYTYSIFKVVFEWAKIANFPRLWRHNLLKSMKFSKIVKIKQFGTPSGHLNQKFIIYQNSGYDVINSSQTPCFSCFGGCLQGLIWSTTPRGQSVWVSKKYADLQIFSEKRPLLTRLFVRHYLITVLGHIPRSLFGKKLRLPTKLTMFEPQGTFSV